MPRVKSIMSRAGWGKRGILVLGLAMVLGGGLVKRAGVPEEGELVGPEWEEELVGPEVWLVCPEK